MPTETTIQLIKVKQDMLNEAMSIFLREPGGFDAVLDYVSGHMINPDEAFIIGHRIATLAAEAAKENKS